MGGERQEPPSPAAGGAGCLGRSPPAAAAAGGSGGRGAPGRSAHVATAERAGPPGLSRLDLLPWVLGAARNLAAYWAGLLLLV